MSPSLHSSRRRFLQVSAATAAGVVLPHWTVAQGAPAIITSDTERPQALQGLQLGDPSNGSVIVWSRSDRPARMLVDWSYDEQFNEAYRIIGPHALDTSDFTARQDLAGLEAGAEVFVRVSFQSLDNDRAIGEPVSGRLVVPPHRVSDKGHGWDREPSDLRFVWGEDTAGQSWGRARFSNTHRCGRLRRANHSASTVATATVRSSSCS